MRNPEYVWMIEEGVRARLISLGAFASVVEYSLGGNTYHVIVDNNEFNDIGEEVHDDED